MVIPGGEPPGLVLPASKLTDAMALGWSLPSSPILRREEELLEGFAIGVVAGAPITVLILPAPTRALPIEDDSAEVSGGGFRRCRDEKLFLLSSAVLMRSCDSVLSDKDCRFDNPFLFESEFALRSVLESGGTGGGFLSGSKGVLRGLSKSISSFPRIAEIEFGSMGEPF